MLSDNMPSANMLSVNMLSVNMLSVMAPVMLHNKERHLLISCSIISGFLLINTNKSNYNDEN
jgi:hypothetical protein